MPKLVKSDTANVEKVIEDFKRCVEKQIHSGEFGLNKLEDVYCRGEYALWLSEKQMQDAFNKVLDGTRLMRSMHMTSVHGDFMERRGYYDQRMAA